MNPSITRASSRPSTRRRIVAIGVVAASLSVVGAGASMAVAPTSSLSRTVAGALHSAGVDWSMMPDGYTQAQYEAFWGAGYTAQDVDALGALWHSDATETKSQAGQLLLDGKTLPVAPGASDAAAQGEGAADDAGADASTVTPAQADAFWGAGYTDADAQALGALWSSGYVETKARAGQMILDGQTPPVAPSGPAVTAP